MRAKFYDPFFGPGCAENSRIRPASGQHGIGAVGIWVRLGYPVLNDCLQSAEADVSDAEEDQPIHRVEERRLRQPCTGTAAVRTEAGSGTSTVVSCSE